MEINVTHMMEDADIMIELSGSRAEHGQNAGQITWNNSKAYGVDHPLLTTDEMRDAARAYFGEYGAWSKEEIEAWSEEELQGMMCQEVASAVRDILREMEAYASRMDDWQANADNAGCLYKGDDGQWYFYLGI